MQYMSFGPDVGHLMEELLETSGAGEVRPGVVRLEPEADRAALDILRRAAEGGWIVELLDHEDEPDTGEGQQIRLRSVSKGEIQGETIDFDTAASNGGYLRLDLNKVEKVHIF
jgi:hypothetical protein